MKTLIKRKRNKRNDNNNNQLFIGDIVILNVNVMITFFFMGIMFRVMDKISTIIRIVYKCK